MDGAVSTSQPLGEQGGGGVQGGNAKAASGPVSGRMGQIKFELEQAKKERGEWEDLLDDAQQYTFPQKQGFKVNNKGDRRGTDIFDETGVVASSELVSRITSGMFPAFSHWAVAEPGIGVPEEDEEEVREMLQIAAATTFEILSQSNINQELDETLQDVLISAGTVKIVPGNHRQPLRFQAIPNTRLYLRCDEFERVDGWFEEYKLSWDAIKRLWPKAKFPEDVTRNWERQKNEKVQVCEAVRVDRSSVRYAVDYDAMVMEKDVKLDNHKWYDWGACPMITSRWTKDPGSAYGRGPILNVLGAIKTANLTVQMVLENADMSIVGLWQGANDGVLNPETVRMYPGTIVPIAPGSEGLAPLQPPGDFNVSELILKDLRHNIRRGLYAMDLGPVEKTPMSATEVVERQAELARNMGSGFARLHQELAIPVLTRCMRLLHDANIIEMPRLDDQIVKMRVLSPLAYEQNMVELQRIDRTIELIGSRFGPQVVNMMIKQDEVSKHYAKLNGMPVEFIRSEDEVRNLAGAVAQMSGAVPTPAADQFTEEGDLPVDQLSLPGADGADHQGMPGAVQKLYP